LLGRSREIAEKRLQAVERKLDKNVELKKAYVDFMQEYERLGHMSKVEETAVENDKANYLPQPTIQNTLFNIILHFRQHIYALTADINKMYL